MTRTAVVLAGLAVPFALTVSACGNGDDDKAAKAISDSIMKQQSGGASTILSVKRKDADCIGKGFVDKIGTKKLEKYGVLSKDLKAKTVLTNAKMSAGDAKSASSVLFSCTDVPAMVTKAIGSADQTKSLPASVKTCIKKAFTEDNLRPVFTDAFQGLQSEVQKDLTAPLMKCARGGAG